MSYTGGAGGLFQEQPGGMDYVTNTDSTSIRHQTSNNTGGLHIADLYHEAIPHSRIFFPVKGTQIKLWSEWRIDKLLTGHPVQYDWERGKHNNYIWEAQNTQRNWSVTVSNSTT